MIIEDIKTGFARTSGKYVEIADRKEAIRWAMHNAEHGDVIVLAGKGHETYQIIGNEHRHFDEREIASEVFADIETIE